MTFFEVEQITEFMDSLERHLDDWVFSRKDMQMLLRELQCIEKKLQKADSRHTRSSSLPFIGEAVEDLRQRTVAFRDCIYERLRA